VTSLALENGGDLLNLELLSLNVLAIFLPEPATIT
jgi:hypothetical protein